MTGKILNQILRTPEDRFKDLPGFPFDPHYIDDLSDYEGLRIHYLDEGPRQADHTFLCLHGEPTWSYLYRKIIPVFVKAGGRVIAPDLFGFGKSDKPIDEDVYTFTFQRTSIMEFIKRLDLHNLTLVCQDWGGLLGLTIPMDMPGRFSRMIVMNTLLATGDFDLPQGCLDWFAWVKTYPDMDVAKLMKRACPHLSPEECRAYSAPFPDSRYKAGVRAEPKKVPKKYDDDGAAISRQARDWWQKEWSGKSFMAIGMRDTVIEPSLMKKLHANIRGCPPALEISEAGHFVQEWGEDVATKALQCFRGL